MFSVARAAYMLRFFGATDVRILNGGMKKWLAEGRETHSGPVENPPSEQTGGDYSYEVVDSGKVIMDITDMHRLTGELYNAPGPGSLDFQIIDARPNDRFTGKVAETRPGLRSGGMKNAFNVPFASLIAEDGTLKSEQELRATFADVGVDLSKETVHTCGSGVTACIVDLTMKTLGHEENHRVYDGSWSEYGSKDEPKW